MRQESQRQVAGMHDCNVEPLVLTHFMLTAGAPFHAMRLHVATKPPQALAEVANSGHDYSDAGEPTAMAATTARANAKWFSY